MDEGTPCSTNADCLRCTDTLTVCTDNADCATGTCAAAPEQPISCGAYCHCGFCEHGDIGIDEPAEPCFDDGECSDARQCTAGDSQTGEQEQPSACSGLTCGQVEEERCCVEGDPACPLPTPLVGKCSQDELISCSAQEDCAATAAGDCMLDRRACFASVITRSGTASSFGGHCLGQADLPAWATNAECSAGQCVPDTATPKLVALFCSTRTGSGALNDDYGLPGPGTLTLETLIRLCRCGDGLTRCAEECDDGNQQNGDGCDERCRVE